MSNSSERKWISASEAARELGLNVETVRKYAVSELGAIRVGRQLRVPLPLQAPTLRHEPRRPISARRANGRATAAGGR